MGCCCGKESKSKSNNEQSNTNNRLKKTKQQQQHKDVLAQGGSVSVFKQVEMAKKKDIIERYQDYPNDADSITQYGIILASEGKDKEALETLKNATEVNSENANSWAAYAEYYERKNNMEKAKEIYEDGYRHVSPKISLDQQDCDLMLNFALNAQNEGDSDKCERLFKRIVTSGPRNPRALGLYATFLHNVRKDRERANTYYKEAADCDPPVSYWCHQYAVFLRDVLNNDTEATVYFKKSSLIV